MNIKTTKSIIFFVLSFCFSVGHAVTTSPMLGWPGYFTTVGPFTTEQDNHRTQIEIFSFVLSRTDKMTLEAAVESIPAYHTDGTVNPALQQVVDIMQEKCQSETASDCSLDELVKILEGASTVGNQP